MNKQGQFYQGDIRCMYVNEIPANAVPVKPQAGRYIIAEGEATGHHHAIDEKFGKLFETPDGTLWLRVAESPAPMMHEEHAPVTFEPGRIVRFDQQCQETAGDVYRVRD